MKRYMGGAEPENPPAPEKTEGFTNPLAQLTGAVKKMKDYQMS